MVNGYDKCKTLHPCRFVLPHRQQLLGLPVGQHISLKADTEGPMLLRPYTPVTPVQQPGFVDFVIKVSALPTCCLVRHPGLVQNVEQSHPSARVETLACCKVDAHRKDG
jgi:Oxidoreductase FAD-binding domain